MSPETATYLGRLEIPIGKLVPQEGLDLADEQQ